MCVSILSIKLCAWSKYIVLKYEDRPFNETPSVLHPTGSVAFGYKGHKNEEGGPWILRSSLHSCSAMERESNAMDSKVKPGACASDVPSYACSSSSNHRRSKSASDKNLDSHKNEASHSMEKCFSENQEPQSLLKARKSYGNQGLSYQDSSDNSVNITLQSRESLKDDTRDLIKEIELLEEEIAKREQHVLSLYRSIFDQCVSEPTTAPSSGMVSPLRAKNGIRKHPSILSTSFCSSKLPLQPSQMSALIKDSAMSNSLPKTKARHESLLNGNMNLHVRSCVSDAMKEKLQSSNQNYLARTLKDHLHQCPSKISEEMIRCMASVYICINKKAEKTHAPFLSRSSTSVVLPRRIVGDDNVWSKRSVIEISSLSINKQSQRASSAINNYRLLVEQLERVDLSKLESNEKLAFWINIYNSLIMHAYLIYGVPHSSLRRLVLFNKAAYNIGGQIITVNTIECSILHCRTTRTGRWLETIFANAMRKKCGGDEKHFPAPLPNLQPLVFFGLCTGASSDPMLRVYTAKNVTEELENAKKEFLQQNIVIKKSRKVILPKILHRYAKEVSINCDDLLGWVCGDVDMKLHEAIKKCRESNCRRKASQFIEWLPYDARFSYVIAKDLVDMPYKVQYT